MNFFKNSFHQNLKFECARPPAFWAVIGALAAFVFLVSSATVAQDAVEATVAEEPQAAQTEAVAQGEALDAEEEAALEELKYDLAVKLHEIRPTTSQVKAAVKNVAERLPYEERQLFLERVMSYIDMEQLEQISIDATMEVFTIEELEVMINYFRTPEAQAISEKMPIYQGIVRPEITKMLDRALLDLRTGKLESQP